MSIADPPAAPSAPPPAPPSAPALTAAARAAEILALLTAGDRRAPLVERVCQISARVLGVSGAGMWLIGGADPRIFVHGTDPLSTDLQSLQVILGEGPGIYAVRAGVPVMVPALAERRVSSWQTYADRALARGVQAVFSFPLRAGTVQLGSLDLYRTQPGPLGATRTADALALAEIATHSILPRPDREHVDGTVSARHWITAGRRYVVDRSPGLAADLGITVEKIVSYAAAALPRSTAGARSS